MSILNCLICGSTNCDRVLTDGTAIHEKCHQQLVAESRSFEHKIESLPEKVRQIEREIEAQGGLGSRMIRWFARKSDSREQLSRQIEGLKSETRKDEEELTRIRESLRRLYDVWPEYPPDWQERRNLKREGKPNVVCGRCRLLADDVHHRIPLGRGGSNRLENLENLCRLCHEKAHGGKEFDDNKSVSVSSVFQEKVNLLRSAMEQGAAVSFRYTDAYGKKTRRTIEPSDFETVEHTLCVVGYCRLRQEQRTFAVRRMSQLEMGE